MCTIDCSYYIVASSVNILEELVLSHQHLWHLHVCYAYQMYKSTRGALDTSINTKQIYMLNNSISL